MNRSLIIKVSILLAAIGLGIAMRMVPSIPNFSPFLAVALFSGIMFKNRIIAFTLPFAVQLFNDLVLTSWHGSAWAVYLGLAAIVVFGRYSNKNSYVSSIAGMLFGAVSFFLITNFAVWMEGTMYPMSFEGLVQSYTMAIPFFKSTLASSLVFATIFHFAFKFATQEKAELAKQKI